MTGGQHFGDDRDRRRFPRVDLTLGARYLLSSGVECGGRVENVSACGCYLTIERTGLPPDPGERVVIYIDKLGRFEGTVARRAGNGFAIDFIISAHKQQRVAQSLERVATGDAAAIEEARRHPRMGADDTATLLRLANGTSAPCKVIDMSLSGASVETHLRPTIGVFVELGRMHARVVRHHETGIAVEFADVAESPRAVQQHFAVAPEKA